MDDCKIWWHKIFHVWLGAEISQDYRIDEYRCFWCKKQWGIHDDSGGK